MDKKTREGEITVSDIPTEGEYEEAKKYFKEKIAQTKEMEIRMDTRYKSTPKYSYATMTARWQFLVTSDIYSHLTDIYEILDSLVDELFKREKQTLELRKQLKRLRKDFRKHKPFLEHLRQTMEQAERVLENGR